MKLRLSSSESRPAKGEPAEPVVPSIYSIRDTGGPAASRSCGAVGGTFDGALEDDNLLLLAIA